MKIQLSEHFTYKKLLRFVLPSIIMMIFTSIYSVVDGLFVSNFVGKTALAAINLTLPIIMGLSALGFMIGTGGSAIVARMLGEKKREKANEYFSMLIYVTAIGGILYPFLEQFSSRQLLPCSGQKASFFLTAFYTPDFLLFPCLPLCCKMYSRAFLLQQKNRILVFTLSLQLV